MICAICGKRLTFGIKVSHSHRRSNRQWKANVRKFRVDVGGTHIRIPVCAKCWRSNKSGRI
jgi:large subunit ribosomal protein L28